MEERTKVDEDYLETFNQGYELSKELGLKSDILNDISAGNNRMQAMQDGMKQYEKELELEKDKSKYIIPPLDLDNIDNSCIDLTPDEKSKDKDIDMDL